MTIPPQRFAAKCWNTSKHVPPAPNSTAKRKQPSTPSLPRVEVQAPAGLKARILKTAAQAENTPATARTTAPARPRRLWLRPLSATLSAAALIALVLLVFDPVGRYRAHAAGRIFRDAAAQLDKSRSFRLEMNVRTLPQENFSYIDAEVPFVPHRMWVEPGSEAAGGWKKQDGSPRATGNGSRCGVPR